MGMDHFLSSLSTAASFFLNHNEKAVEQLLEKSCRRTDTSAAFKILNALIFNALLPDTLILLSASVSAPWFRPYKATEPRES